ncbi:putative Polyadenylate-binding protein [Zostera marina]|uniref:Polyadenylate-binding protein n=1 Tax=Zostera marina TaxID=29655 RepID=A0A0K9PJ56_ZOSMR|nr:putative Polyadenylate-binding protein [Zostera marina]
MAQTQVPPQAQMQVAISGANVAAGAAAGVPFNSLTSLYVGDLDPTVTDSQIFDLFNQFGQVVSVRVCRDIDTRRSLGYAYVNYNNPPEAARALEILNFTPMNGKPIRIMYSNRDPSTRKSGAANIFIKNLDKAIDNKALYDTFCVFGNILSCKLAMDRSGNSKGYGFVQFEKEDSAQVAIGKLNGMLINGKQVFVGPFLRKQDRDNTVYNVKFNNIFVKNFSETMTEDDLKKKFSEFGKITSAVVMRKGDGKSKCFGFVNFDNSEDAANAVDALNGKKFDDKEWYVGRAQKKSEREQELKVKYEQNIKETVEKNRGLNLFLKNIDDSVSDEKLKELFSDFGTITSCKVMRDSNGVSRGSGFVAFSTAEEAANALNDMNGKMIANKPLYVALAQRKEERSARLQAQFAHMPPVPMQPSGVPRMPMYPASGPGIGQQLFYGQTPPALISHQPGFGYQQQLLPGMRPGGTPFFMPFVQQGQQGPRPGGGRRPGPGGHIPMVQQQMFPRGGRMYRFPSGRNIPEMSIPGASGGMLSSPFDMGGFPGRDGAGISQPIPISALASSLANAPPAQQRMMLGETLYPLVGQIEQDMASKVTGMLLEMDQTEVLHLLESPEALKAKVSEAMEVLRNLAPQQHQNTPVDQLAGLSLNDGEA